jgi:hypothetical protein
MNKKATIVLILIITATSLTFVKTAYSQVPVPPFFNAPHVPEFTLKYVDASYNITSKDPFTGANKTQLIDDRNIVLSIKNQPVPTSETIFLEVRIKGHFEVNWTDWTDLIHYENNFKGGIMQKPASDYTTISFVLGDNAIFPIFRDLPPNSQIDFQMEAVLGHTITISLNHLDGSPGAGIEEVTAIDTTSGWSNTQTLAIPEPPSASPTPSVPPTPTQKPTPEHTTEPSSPESMQPTQEPTTSPKPNSPTINPYLILIPVLIAVVAVIAALVYVKKNKRNSDAP